MDTLTKRACLLACGILALLLACILILLRRQGNSQPPPTAHTAYIYQDGQLLQAIPLAQVSEPYLFTIEATDGGYNILEISPGGVSIAEADCPDQVCVRQGRITDSLLPITCLPHRLVIALRPDNASPGSPPDAVAY